MIQYVTQKKQDNDNWKGRIFRNVLLWLHMIPIYVMPEVKEIDYAGVLKSPSDS